MYYYIVNPAAGGGAINAIQERLKATLHSLKIDGEFAKTLGPGDAATVTEKALERRAKTIVAVGGSETINEIISAIYRRQAPEVAIGIIPTGKHNHLARSLGITSWREACEILASRRLMEYSLVSVNEYVFIQSLFITIPPPQPEADEQPRNIWQKFRSVVPANTPSISFQARFDNKLKLRASADHFAVYNQKFLDSTLDNSLLTQIYTPAVTSSQLKTRLGSWLGAGKPPLAQSQIHSHTLDLKSPRLLQAELDGKTITNKHFAVTLTDWQLKLITNLPGRR